MRLARARAMAVTVRADCDPHSEKRAHVHRHLARLPLAVTAPRSARAASGPRTLRASWRASRVEARSRLFDARLTAGYFNADSNAPATRANPAKAGGAKPRVLALPRDAVIQTPRRIPRSPSYRKEWLGSWCFEC